MDLLRQGYGWPVAETYRVVFLLVALALLVAGAFYAPVRDIKPNAPAPL